MNGKKALMTLAITLALVCGMAIGASAADTLKEISAYLNYGITIKYNGEAQDLTDAAGNRVYPITYNGTTYLPVRAVSNLLGIGVDWDGATQTVLLGEKADGTDLIDNFKPYNSYTTDIDYRGSLDPEFIQSSEKQTTTIGGNTVSHWFAVRLDYLDDDAPECSFNLGGKYDTLTFQTYADKDMTLIVTGDNDSVLGQFSLKGGQVPQSLTIDLHGTTQLTFDCEKVPGSTSYTGDGKVWCTYIFDAILK
ncbi:stalk domain-containing protein [Acutalibacter muris]|uniref:stalk domain-containing protein n=1 Tax=Acutalibacter muris TaxID=1796620 RepID=UPI00272DE156|nr:stalk domain-containing protein [Acutalibacter muris]